MSDGAPLAGRRLSLQLPASHASVRVGRNLVVRLARFGGVAAAELDGLRLVASELLANAVDHGGGEGARDDADAAVTMQLEFVLDTDRWALEVHDQGGVDVAEITPLLGQDLPDLEDERGRGFFLLEQALDSLEVATSSDGRGLTFRAKKSL